MTTMAELLAEAERRLAERPAAVDPAFVLACALERLAEEWAADSRPICSACGKRRAGQRGDICTLCLEQHELQLHHKLKWFHENAERVNAAKRDRRREAQE